MADIICVIGNKGGTGKTTFSHMLCQGMGLVGQRSVCVLTDTDREPLDPTHRRYLTADARSSEALAKVVDKIRSLPAWLGVIDGGGNRTEMDRKLYALADLVLLPFRDSHEDIRTVTRDLERFPHAYAVPMQWPTNVWQRESAEKTVGEFLHQYHDRILDPISVLSASKLLLQKQLPISLPTPLNNACRQVAHQVVDLLQIQLTNEQIAPTRRSAPATHALYEPSAPSVSSASVSPHLSQPLNRTASPRQPQPPHPVRFAASA
ncbi:MAG: hypothetical protein RL695_224 [Pseudomonadota bacterium]